MLFIKRFINELMSSNCYVIHDDKNQNCIIVDPASEDCKEIIQYLTEKNFFPQYIILTHEHTDHTWGCNTLIEKYNLKIISSQACKQALPKEGKAYFQFYYDDPNYHYSVKQVDIVLEDIDYKLEWNGYLIKFLYTPGHSEGSVCFSIENNLFTGDTIMPYKPFFSKKNGSFDKFQLSIKKIFDVFDSSMTVYPGHGNNFKLFEYPV